MALIASATSPQGQPNLAAPINTTGANAILLTVVGSLGATGDSKNSNAAYTLVASVADLKIYVLASPTVGADHQFSAQNNYEKISVFAFSNMNVASLVDVFAQVSGASSPSSAASVSPTTGNSVVVTAAQTNTNGNPAPTASAGYIQVGSQAPIGGVSYGHGSAYKIVTGTAAEDPEWTFASGTAEVITVVLREAGAGPTFRAAWVPNQSSIIGSR